jgi:hypothetical protein
MMTERWMMASAKYPSQLVTIMSDAPKDAAAQSGMTRSGAIVVLSENSIRLGIRIMRQNLA